LLRAAAARAVGWLVALDAACCRDGVTHAALLAVVAASAATRRELRLCACEFETCRCPTS
jgi:hypothetical protein